MFLSNASLPRSYVLQGTKKGFKDQKTYASKNQQDVLLKVLVFHGETHDLLDLFLHQRKLILHYFNIISNAIQLHTLLCPETARKRFTSSTKASSIEA